MCDGRVLKARILWDLAVELTKRDALTMGPIIEKACRKKINEEERILKWAREVLFFLQQYVTYMSPSTLLRHVLRHVLSHVLHVTLSNVIPITLICSSDTLERTLEGGSYEELDNILIKIRILGFEQKCARLVFRAKLKQNRINKFQVW